MRAEVTVILKWPVSATNATDALSTLDYLARIRRGYPALEVTATVKDTDTGETTAFKLEVPHGKGSGILHPDAPAAAGG